MTEFSVRPAQLRTNLLKLVDKPVVMETHGGYGAIWNQCYSHLTHGVVFEKDPDKTSVLAVQRPSWAVYECDCVTAIAAGGGASTGQFFGHRPVWRAVADD